MNSLKRIATGVLLGGWAIVAVASAGFAQVSPQATPRTPWRNASPPRADWEQRSTKGWRARRAVDMQNRAGLSEAPPWPTTARRATPWTGAGGASMASRQPGAGGAAVMEGPDTAYEDLDLTLPAVPAAPESPGPYQGPPGGPYPGAAYGAGSYGPGSYGPGYPTGSCVSGSSFDPSGSACGGCGNPCGGACGWGPGAFWGPSPFRWIRNISVFAGAHAFKGPPDWGLNGNFGLNYGIDWGGPLGDPWATGMQIGFQGAHSNFQGHQVVGDGTVAFNNGDRDQLFFTAGIFRRNLCGGIQGGVAFDLMHDAYYYTADLRQVRVEISAVWPGWREFGFWGAFGVGDDQVVVPGVNAFTLQPMDQFNFFYRRFFRNGGESRIWAGFTGQNDFLLGGELWIPVSTHFGVQSSFTFMVPNENGLAAQQEESWGLTMQVVWYPGRSVRTSRNNPFRPLFRTADNSFFLVDRN